MLLGLKYILKYLNVFSVTSVTDNPIVHVDCEAIRIIKKKVEVGTIKFRHLSSELSHAKKKTFDLWLQNLLNKLLHNT